MTTTFDLRLDVDLIELVWPVLHVLNSRRAGCPKATLSSIIDPALRAWIAENHELLAALPRDFVLPKTLPYVRRVKLPAQPVLGDVDAEERGLFAKAKPRIRPGHAEPAKAVPPVPVPVPSAIRKFRTTPVSITTTAAVVTQVRQLTSAFDRDLPKSPRGAPVHPVLVAEMALRRFLDTPMCDLVRAYSKG
ncbi:hypothetical protein ACSW29_27345 [Rhodococcus sp. GB-02]